jgi:hypothetical protein
VQSLFRSGVLGVGFLPRELGCFFTVGLSWAVKSRKVKTFEISVRRIDCAGQGLPFSRGLGNSESDTVKYRVAKLKTR